MKKKFCLCFMALATIFSIGKNFTSIDKNQNSENDLSEMVNATGNSDIAAINKGRYNRPTTIFDDDASTGNYGEYHVENNDKYQVENYGEYQVENDDEYYIGITEDKIDDSEDWPIILASPEYNGGMPKNYKAFASSTLKYGDKTSGGDMDDWYCFSLTGCATVTIRLENQSYMDIFYFVYACDNSTHSFFQKRQADVYWLDEEGFIRTGELNAGAYLIKVYCNNDYEHVNGKYNISLRVDYTINEYISTRDYTIEELNNKYVLTYGENIGGAIWMSDYDPFGYKLFNSFSNNKISETGGLINAPFYRYLEEKGTFTHAILYVWNTKLRNELCDVFDFYRSLIDTKLSDFRGKKMIIEKILRGAGGVATGLKILGHGSIFFNIGLAMANSLLELFFPEQEELDLEQMREWFGEASSALAWGTDEDKQEFNDIVKIPLIYKYEVERADNTSRFKILKYAYCNFVQPIPDSGRKWKTNKDEYIRCFPENSNFPGRIYSLQKGSDLLEAANHTRKNNLNFDDLKEAENEDSYDFDKNGIYEFDLVANQKAVCNFEFNNGGNVVLQTFSNKKTKIEVFDYLEMLGQIDVKPLFTKTWDLSSNNAFVCFTPEKGKEYKVVAYFDEQYETGGGKLGIGVTNCSRKVNSFDELVLLKNAEGKGKSSSSIPYTLEPYCETGRIICTKTSVYKLKIGLTEKYEIYNASITIVDVSGEETPKYYTLRGDKNGNVSTSVSLQEGKKYYFVIHGNYVCIPSTLISSIYWEITMTEGDDSNTESEEEMLDKIFERHNRGNKNRDFFF